VEGGSPAVSKTAKSILVVDDNPDVCAFMRVALEGAGYEVQTVSEGTQMLPLLRKHPTDLLITDIFMPVQEGFETIEQCKTQFPKINVIAMSAGSTRGMTHDFLETASLLGVDATLRKPFGVDQLLDTVRRVLQTR